MVKQILTFSTFITSFLFGWGTLRSQDSLHTKAPRMFRFRTLELEAQVAPKEKEFMSSANYLLEVGKHSFLKSYFFGEYNFTSKEYAFTVSLDPKIYGPLHLTTSFENDLFGEKPEKYHFQSGIKMYLEDVGPFSNWFSIASIGLNYSLLGNAEHKLGKTEGSYNFLTNPIMIGKNFAIVVQSMGRIRSGYDFHFIQIGFEPRKIEHSVFMIGTGQVQKGQKEIFMGFQFAFVENHREFKW
jgi:hypothetical protein